MWGAMQGAEVRKDLLEADARDRKSQCRSSGEKIAGDMAIFTCPNSIHREPNVRCIKNRQKAISAFARGRMRFDFILWTSPLPLKGQLDLARPHLLGRRAPPHPLGELVGGGGAMRYT